MFVLLDIDECASDPCQYGGQCEQLVGFYRCECPDEYVGTNCQTGKGIYHGKFHLIMVY